MTEENAQQEIERTVIPETIKLQNQDDTRLSDAEKLQKQKSLNDLKEKTDKLAERFPDSSLVQNSASRAALQSGDTKTALSRADKAVALAEQKQDPKLLADALKTRALANYDSKDFAKAFADAQRTLKLFPNDAAALAIAKLTEGRVAGNQHSPANAGGKTAELQDLLTKTRPSAVSRPAGFGKSVALTKQAETDLRLENYEEMYRKASLALAKLPNNPKAYMQRAFAGLMLKKYDAAIADASAGLKLKPAAASLLGLRAAAYNEKGEPKKALEDAQKAVDVNPKDPFAWLQKGLAREKMGEPDDQYLADIKNAAEIDPQFEHFYTEALARRSKPAQESRRMAPSASTLGFRPGAVVAGALAASLLGGLGAYLLLGGRRKAQRQDVVGGSFKLGRLIATGGMGSVYEAWDENLERTVAVKRMSAELRNDPEEAARFVQEAKTVARLKHPNIVAIHDAFQEAGETYLVFELIRGETLEMTLRKSGGKLAVSPALQILSPICTALDYAHERGVIHRDLKPVNIMLEDGTVKIMDFGIARVTQDPGRHTQTSKVIGTPIFMAPEQQYGEVSRESDLYAVAVCAYLMLSGRLPFEGDLALARKQEGRFEPISRWLPGAPQALDAFFARALSPERARRFHTAGELFAALRESAGA